jgi:hypothetical protein
MKDAHGRKLTGRTSWWRFGVLCVPGLGVTAALAIALANGALGASFAVSGQQFKVSAKNLDGDGFAQYGSIDRNSKGETIPVAVTAIKKAEMNDLCQSVVTRLPVIGSISLHLTAGTGDKPVRATNLFVDATQLSGSAGFNEMEVGRDASTLDKGPKGAKGLEGLFGQQANDVHIDDLRQTAWATNAGEFRLADLSMKLKKGTKECF